MRILPQPKQKRLILPVKIPERPRKVISSPDLESSISRNLVIIGGIITDLASPRYTPAGIMVAEFKLSHCSNQQEAGIQRRIEFEFEAIAIAETAEKIICIGSGNNVEITGFIAKKNRLSNQLVLHVRDTRII